MTDAFQILFVDDEETFLFSTADLLRREGYECDCAPEVYSAQALLEQKRYDLVIADIKMPGNSDLEFVRQLSQTPDAPPVILVTGHPSIGSAMQSVELPVVAYLVKPFDIHELLTKVQNVVASAEVHRVVRQEQARLQEYRQRLAHVEARLRRPSRAGHDQSLQAFVGMTLRHVVEGLANVHHLVEMIGGEEGGGELAGAPAALPGNMRAVLEETVATLERTKNAFKSKELGELRRKLEGLLKSPCVN